MEEIKFKVGNTIIRRDGLKGKIVAVPTEIACFGMDAPSIEASVKYENGESWFIFSDNYNEFYLIGDTVLGNKVAEEKIEKQIAEKEREIQKAKKEKAQLRKQLWRLREEMVDDWRERKALRELRKKDKEKQSTEETTED